jgi:predicted permease
MDADCKGHDRAAGVRLTMRTYRQIKRFLGNLLHRRRAEDALGAELSAYLDEMTDRKIGNGMHPEEARRQASMEAGGIQQIKEEVRDAWLGQGVETALKDVRYGCRSLVRSPGFTAAVVVTLALGIAANLTIFSVMRAVLWRPLPYPEPNRIVEIQVDARNVANTGATRRELLSLQERSRCLEDVSTVDGADANLEYAGTSEYVTAASGSDNFLPLLGARPALGRALDSRVDASAQGPLAVLISDQLWQRRFSADPAVIGKSIRVNDIDVQIAGVLPAGFRLFLPPSITDLEDVDIWFPYRIDPIEPYRGVPLLARLRPGVTLEQANAELQMLAVQFERENPGFYSGPNGWQASPFDRGPGAKVHFAARLLQDDMTSEVRPRLFLLSALVVFVLVIACVNVANLLLARGLARQRELSIRRSLGAPRSRLIRQLLAESLVLALVSAGIGLLSAQIAVKTIAHQNAWHFPLQARVAIDGPVMVFALFLSVVTSILSGAIPAWRLATNSTGQLRAGRSETTRSAARRLQRILVVMEIALSIVPLVCGGLMLRSFLNLLHTPLGFDPSNVVTASIPLDSKRYPTLEQRWILLRSVLDKTRAIPGVEAASAVDVLPLQGQATRRVGREDRPDSPPILASQQFAFPGYLHTIRTALLQGRDFTDEDITKDRPVAIIDQELARRLWPEGAIGKQLVIYRTGRRDVVEVIGVTNSARLTRVRDQNTPRFLFPYGKYPSGMSLVIRTPTSADKLAPQIKAVVDKVRPGQAVLDVRGMRDYVSDSMGDTRFMVFALTVFAAASVLLAAVGLYGTLTYLTLQRTREFGIRLALGSSRKAIIAIVVQETAILTLVGTALGLLGASVMVGTIRGMLYGVRPLDGMTFVGVVGLVGIIALGSATIPAWRAAGIDPQISLRSE